MIVGVDEAGRGPLAGPVVAAAVVLCPDGIPGLNDSKKLSEKRRIALEDEIKARCRWAIGVVDVDDIDRINIFVATMRAMTLAVTALGVEPDEVLIVAQVPRPPPIHPVMHIGRARDQPKHQMIPPHHNPLGRVARSQGELARHGGQCRLD